MTFPPPSLRSTANLEVLLNTLEAERHARGALLVAFVDELRAATMDRAPESTRELLKRAERGEMGEPEFRMLLDELRAFARTAA